MYPDVADTGLDPWHHYVLSGKKDGRDNGLHPKDGMFFAEGYLEMYPDVVQSGLDPWHHYVLVGKQEGRDNGLHPKDDMFFAEGYLEMYPDIAKTGIDPWHDYVLAGKSKGRDNGLHPKGDMFFVEGYLEIYPDIEEAGIDAWHHYVLFGKKEGRDCGLHPKEDSFFPEGYLEMYPDVAKSGFDPWHHYAMHGKKEGRDNGLHPGDNQFFREGYLEMYPDAAESGINPWRHYVLTGSKEGRDNGLHPKDELFFAEGYLEMYPDVVAAGIEPWHHYILSGKAEGRDNGQHPSADQFFPEGYLEMYPDVSGSSAELWHHYVLLGKPEGRDNGLHPDDKLFFPEGYLINYPDVKSTGMDPWKHYVLYGKAEGRNSGFSDYIFRILGHENEVVKTIYLAANHSHRNSGKILLIGHDFSVTGAPLSLLYIARIFRKDGYSVDIAVKDESHIKNEIYIYDGLGSDVFLLPNSAECFDGAEKIVRNYDFVVINTVVMGAYAALCRKMNVPHIWFVREDLPSIQGFFDTIPGCRKNFFDDWDNILCVSRYVSERLNHEYKINCRYINNFINDIKFPAAPANNRSKKNESHAKRTFAIVGSVDRRKAQESAIAAFMTISATPGYKEKWKLLLIGSYGNFCADPALGNKLLTVSRNVPDIVWCGQVTERKWELFSTADFFIVPSLEEASSRVAIEAAMLGKPVICTSHVGAKYLTENNAGFIFEPGNIAELRKIIQKCLDMSDGEYIRMSRQVRLNYEETSTPAVYHKALTAAVKDAVGRCHPEMPSSEKYNSSISLRSLGSGRNAFCFDRLEHFRFEYINFADFGSSEKSEDDLHSDKDIEEQNSEVGVVIPVFNGADRLKVLIPLLFRNTDLPHKFVFVDDCSDKETEAFLTESVRGRDDCILIRNNINLGFVKSANRGAEKALESCSSFVILDPDTEVPSGWLGRMMRPIMEDETISSVMPLSNECGIFSFPFPDKTDRNNDFIREFGVDNINEAIKNSCVRGVFDIPSCNSFCLAISGKVWKKIGGLNEELFGSWQAACEEWGLRAGMDGFRNVQIANLCVAHHKSCTAEAKDEDGSAAREIISVMFPSYESRLQSFAREYPLSGSIISIYLSLAKMHGYKAELFADSAGFKARMAGEDGILVLRTQNVTKLAVRLLGETVLVGNVRNLDRTGIFDA